jgi:hypothetical protein
MKIVGIIVTVFSLTGCLTFGSNPEMEQRIKQSGQWGVEYPIK